MPASYWDLDEDMLGALSFTNFTQLMTKSKLTKAQVVEAKKTRRRVKNRYSARVCSKLRRDRCNTTEGANADLIDQVEALLSENTALHARVEALQTDVSRVREEAAAAHQAQHMLTAELQRVTALPYTSQSSAH
jgi:hypothetical protein